MSKEYVTKPKHVRVVYRPPHSTSQLEPDPVIQTSTATQPIRSWNHVSRSTWTDESDNEDLDGDNGFPNNIVVDNNNLDSSADSVIRQRS